MTTTKTLKSLLIPAWLRSVAARAADSAIVIAFEDGKQVPLFNAGDSQAVLKDDEICYACAG